MSQAGKGSKPRPINRKAWEESKLWDSKKDRKGVVYLDPVTRTVTGWKLDD